MKNASKFTRNDYDQLVTPIESNCINSKIESVNRNISSINLSDLSDKKIAKKIEKLKKLIIQANILSNEIESDFYKGSSFIF